MDTNMRRKKFHESAPSDVDVGDADDDVVLRRGVGDEDVDDSKRQHGADLLVGQAGAEKLLLGHLKARHH